MFYYLINLLQLINALTYIQIYDIEGKECYIYVWNTRYKSLWDVGGKGRDSSLQEGVSCTYTLILGYSRILSCIIKKKWFFSRNT